MKIWRKDEEQKKEECVMEDMINDYHMPSYITGWVVLPPVG